MPASLSRAERLARTRAAGTQAPSRGLGADRRPAADAPGVPRELGRRDDALRRRRRPHGEPGAPDVALRRPEKPEARHRARRARCGNQNVQDTFNLVHFEWMWRERSLPELRRSWKQRRALGLKERAKKTSFLSERDEFQGCVGPTRTGGCFPHRSNAAASAARRSASPAAPSTASHGATSTSPTWRSGWTGPPTTTRRGRSVVVSDLIFPPVGGHPRPRRGQHPEPVGRRGGRDRGRLRLARRRGQPPQGGRLHRDRLAPGRGGRRDDRRRVPRRLRALRLRRLAPPVPAPVDDAPRPERPGSLN